MRLALVAGVVLLALAVGSATVGRSTSSREAPSTGRTDARHDYVPELERLRDEGVSLARSGRLAEARRRFRAGLEAARRTGKARHEARFLANLGNIELHLRQYAGAMTSYLEARRVASRARDPLLAAALGLNISGVYLATGAVDDAALALDRALDALPSNAPAGYAAPLLGQRSVLAARLGEWDKAWSYYREAVRRADAEGLWSLQADILDGFGYELFRAGRSSAAAALFLNAFRIRRLHSVPVPAHSFRNLGMMAAAEGDAAQALRFLDTAIEEALLRPDGTPLWSLYYHRAGVYEESGRLRDAMADLERCLDVIQRLRSEILPAEAVRRHTDVGLHQVFQRAVAVAMRLYRSTGSESWMRRAFEIAARGQAAGLAASLGEAERLRANLPVEYWETLQRVSAAETAALAGKQAPDELPRWRHRLAELEVEAGLQFRQSAGRPPVTVDQLQRALGSSEACLLFHVSEPVSYLWILTTDSLQVRELPGRAALREAVVRFRNAVARSSPEAHARGSELYELLFGEATPAPGRRDWILLVEDALFKLPFAALALRAPDGGPRYLIERRTLRLAPSAVLLTSPRRDRWRGGLLAVGDPVYNRADPRWRAAEPSWPMRENPEALELPRLPGAAREIAACLRQWRSAGEPAAALTGVQANRSALAEALRRRPAVVHFATHVLAPGGAGHRGFVALSLRPGGRLDMLGSTEIRALGCRAELVVLSGCSSGTGEILPGSGLLGLTRAWLRAGAAHVLATLWPVRDDAGELWQEFYRRLGPVGEEGFAAPPHRALQAAQVHLIRNHRRRPADWAGYFLISTE